MDVDPPPDKETAGAVYFRYHALRCLPLLINTRAELIHRYNYQQVATSSHVL